MKSIWLKVLVAGPVTGPLLHYLMLALERQQFVRAGIYILGIVEFWFIGPYLLALEHSLLLQQAAPR